jgi:hypothetical protein
MSNGVCRWPSLCLWEGMRATLDYVLPKGTQEELGQTRDQTWSLYHPFWRVGAALKPGLRSPTPRRKTRLDHRLQKNSQIKLALVRLYACSTRCSCSECQTSPSQ